MASVLMKHAMSLLGRPEAGAAPVAPRKAPTTYHAVSIAPGAKACGAARKLEDRRFLSREAPVLPLKACDCSNCTCRYVHYEDRRKGGRRARDLGVSIDGYTDDEKRTKAKRGRRKSD